MRPIAEYEPMDRERFEREIVPKGEPAVFRGLVADWPVVRAGKDGTRRSPKCCASPRRTSHSRHGLRRPRSKAGSITMRISAASTSSGGWRRVDQLLDLLLRQSGQERPYSMYAGGIPIRKHLPGLIPNIPVTMLDMARETLISLWIGNRTHTATHWDQSQNLACVVAGRRRFTLFPPEQLKNLYVGPLEFTLAGQPISLVDIDAPDLETYPRFAEALKTARRAELGPGDALYIPACGGTTFSRSTISAR